MQLSLLPPDKPRYFLDLYAQVVFDPKRKRPRLKTLTHQTAPPNLTVHCPIRLFREYPIGTICKVDARLVQCPGKQPYLIAVNRRMFQKALEFFDHNIQIQNREEAPSKKTTVRRRTKRSAH